MRNKNDSETESTSSLTQKDMLNKYVENSQTNLLNQVHLELPHLQSTHVGIQSNTLLLKPANEISLIKDALDLSLPNRSRLTSDTSSTSSSFYGGLNDSKFPQVSSEVSLSPLSYTSSNLSINVTYNHLYNEKTIL
jgi:hypothetical protein